MVNHRRRVARTARKRRGRRGRRGEGASSPKPGLGNWKLSRERNNECPALWPLMESKHRCEMPRQQSALHARRDEAR